VTKLKFEPRQEFKVWETMNNGIGDSLKIEFSGTTREPKTSFCQMEGFRVKNFNVWVRDGQNRKLVGREEEFVGRGWRPAIRANCETILPRRTGWPLLQQICSRERLARDSGRRKKKKKKKKIPPDQSARNFGTM
jgi:hypothetical protein